MTLKVSRDWATPLTMGTFAFMAATGLLMFYHLHNPLQEALHSWVGWVIVVAVLLHAAANWASFKRYFQTLGRTPLTILVVALLFTASFFLMPKDAEGQHIPTLAVQTLIRAPLHQVAPLFSKSAEQARSELAAAGIVLADVNTPIAQAVGGEREKIGKALRTLAAGSGPVPAL